MEKTRLEADSMGDIEIAADKYWGPQTQRSLENFPISSETMPSSLIHAIATIKKATALANANQGVLDSGKAEAISYAANLIIAGEFAGHFPLKIWQTGSGTQTNMNVNEVIAHIVNEKFGANYVHPNDDVNKGQSSNDVFPTAMQVATVVEIYEHLLPIIDTMILTLKDLSKKYQHTLKTGRTHLQDATPITFGQEVSGWQAMLENSRYQIAQSAQMMHPLPLGGTAVGTGLNAHPTVPDDAIKAIAELTGYPFVPETNKFYGLASKEKFVTLHGAIKGLAANCMKIANDIRWLASGPRAGLGEITIPANEPGSSIMPGKVNPTQVEALTMIATQVMGNDVTISIAASQGNFELNVYMPVIIYNMMQSIQLLTDGIASFNSRCLEGLTANEERMAEQVNQSLMLVTPLTQHIGYDKASKIAHQAYRDNMTLKQAAVASGYITAAEFDKIVNPKNMI